MNVSWSIVHISGCVRGDGDAPHWGERVLPLNSWYIPGTTIMPIATSLPMVRNIWILAVHVTLILFTYMTEATGTETETCEETMNMLHLNSLNYLAPVDTMSTTVIIGSFLKCIIILSAWMLQLEKNESCWLEWVNEITSSSHRVRFIRSIKRSGSLLRPMMVASLTAKGGTTHGMNRGSRMYWPNAREMTAIPAGLGGATNRHNTGFIYKAKLNFLICETL